MGATPSGGVAAVKRSEQVVEGTSVVLVLTQAARMSASVLISVVGRMMLLPEVTAWPVVVLARLEAGPRALVMPRRLVEEVPMLVVPAESVAKGASA